MADRRNIFAEVILWLKKEANMMHACKEKQIRSHMDLLSTGVENDMERNFRWN